MRAQQPMLVQRLQRLLGIAEDRRLAQPKRLRHNAPCAGAPPAGPCRSTRCARRRPAAPRWPRPPRPPGSPTPTRRSTRRTGAASSAPRAWYASSPSTRSASTAPASTDANWSGSPTRINRASGRTASSSRAIIVNDTIDVSSTTITSCGSRLPRLWRNLADVSGRLPEQPVQRRRMHPRQRLLVGRVQLADLQLHRLLQPGRRLARRRRQRDPQTRSARSASNASSRATVVVLPVPGPPVSTVKPLRQRDFRRRALLLEARREQPVDVRRHLLRLRRDHRAARRRRPAALRSQYRSRYSRSPSTRSAGGVPASGLAANGRQPRRRHPATAARPRRPAARPTAGPRTPTRSAAPAPPTPLPARPSRRAPSPAR